MNMRLTNQCPMYIYKESIKSAHTMDLIDDALRLFTTTIYH